MSGKRSATLFGTMLLLVVCFLALVGDFASAASLNLASLHLNRAVFPSAVSPEFPYILESRARENIDRAVAWDQMSARYNANSDRMSCTLLRAYFVTMAWEAARVVAESGRCEDLIVDDFKPLWPILRGMREHEQGNWPGARQEFRRALVVGSGLLSLSLDRWLAEAHQSSAVPSFGRKAPRSWWGTPSLMSGRLPRSPYRTRGPWWVMIWTKTHLRRGDSCPYRCSGFRGRPTFRFRQIGNRPVLCFDKMFA